MLVSSFVLIVRFSTLLCIFPFIHAILLLFPPFFIPGSCRCPAPFFPAVYSSNVRPVFSVVSRCRTLIAGQRPTHVKVAAAYPFFRSTQIARILFFGFFYFLLQSFRGGAEKTLVNISRNRKSGPHLKPSNFNWNLAKSRKYYCRGPEANLAITTGPHVFNSDPAAVFGSRYWSFEYFIWRENCRENGSGRYVIEWRTP